LIEFTLPIRFTNEDRGEWYRSLQIVLYDFTGPHCGLIWILTGGSTCSALAQKIPALIEFGFYRFESVQPVLGEQVVSIVLL
jgi:hypothetical protein